MFSKLLFIDTETTGLYESIHEPYQIAVLVQINGKLVEEKVFHLQPINWDRIEQKALDINNMTRDELMTYEKPVDVFVKIKQLFSKYVSVYDKNDKFICVGYNVRFDMGMMNQLFKKLGDRYFYSLVNSRHELDVLQKIKWLQYESKVPILQNLKLETVCNHFGIEFQAHDALEDIKATRKLMQIVSDL